MSNKVYNRKDNGCKARVLALLEDDRVLFEATWGKDNRNIVVVSQEYFKEKYGVYAQ